MMGSKRDGVQVSPSPTGVCGVAVRDGLQVVIWIRSESRKEAKVEMMLTRFEPANPPAAKCFACCWTFLLFVGRSPLRRVQKMHSTVHRTRKDKKLQNKSNGRFRIAFFALSIVSLSSTLQLYIRTSFPVASRINIYRNDAARATTPP